MEDNNDRTSSEIFVTRGQRSKKGQKSNIKKSFHIETHDQLLPVYLSSLVRSIVALHCLINNKITNSAGPADADQKEKKKQDKETKEPIAAK